MQKKQEELDAIEVKVVEINELITKLAKRRSVAEKLLTRLQNLERQFGSIIEESDADFTELGIKVEDVISVNIHSQLIEDIITKCTQELVNKSKQLEIDKPGSLTKQRTNLIENIISLQNQLSAPQKSYQEYLNQNKQWGEQRLKLIGSKDINGTIAYYENQIELVKAIPKYKRKIQRQCDRKIFDIYNEKLKLRDYYSKYYESVQKFLSGHHLAKDKDFKLTFNVSIVEGGFSDGFLKHIDQRKVGSFSGVEEGTSALRDILERVDFDSPITTALFTRKISRMLREVKRGGRLETLNIKDQISQNSSLLDLYNYVCGLEYLHPIYNLSWDSKGIEQLSPGERGNILLIFYLLVDRNDIPLVIDQPEENLDNQTVFKTLVPCIKDAKKRRQIIMVTHNPNLAVVCDAEQVICAEIKKEQGNEVVYLSGSIEDIEINKKIVDILEGTRPAFDKRDSKYHRTKLTK